jgi:hypothetical protein
VREEPTTADLSGLSSGKYDCPRKSAIDYS